MNPHYDSITAYVNGMISKVESMPNLRETFGLAHDPAIWLKEFKTVGYSTPRQVGGQFWLHSQAMVNDNTFLLVPHRRDKDMIRDNYYRDGSHHVHWQNNNSSDDLGLGYNKARRIMVHDEFVNIIKSGQSCSTNDKFLGLDIDRLYIQNSDQLFKRLRANKVYDFLAGNIFQDGNGWIIKYQ